MAFKAKSLITSFMLSDASVQLLGMELTDDKMLFLWTASVAESPCAQAMWVLLVPNIVSQWTGP